MDTNKKKNDQKHAVDEAKQKRLYERPKLTAVSLFADQVLGFCNKLPQQSDYCNLLAKMS